MVVAHWRHPDGGARPHVLFYGHYDVQPVDPLDLWDTPPFEPRIENNIVYARGACDDKGQVYTHLKALEGYIETGTELPVNVKFIIEGEEESGSPNFHAWLFYRMRNLHIIKYGNHNRINGCIFSRIGHPCCRPIG